MTTSFLDLPPEVRIGIYQYLFLTELNLIISPLDNSAYHDLQPAILRTCKLIEEEARAVLYHENTFVHVIHDIPLFEIEASNFQFSLLGRHHSQLFPQMCSLEVSIITQPDTTTGKHHIMIPSEDLELMCTILGSELVEGLKEGQKNLDVYLDFSESVNGMTLSANRQDELLLPFKRLFRASSITIKGEVEKNLAIEVQDARLNSSPIWGVALMELTLLSVMRLPEEERIMRRRQNMFAGMLATI